MFIGKYKSLVYLSLCAIHTGGIYTYLHNVFQLSVSQTIKIFIFSKTSRRISVLIFQHFFSCVKVVFFFFCTFSLIQQRIFYLVSFHFIFSSHIYQRRIRCIKFDILFVTLTYVYARQVQSSGSRPFPHIHSSLCLSCLSFVIELLKYSSLYVFSLFRITFKLQKYTQSFNLLQP